METPSITPERWAELGQDMARMYATAYFLTTDGILICAIREPVDEGRTEIAVYIDGYIEWKHAADLVTDPDELPDPARRFWRQRRMARYSPAKRKNIEKRLGKRQAKQFFPDLHETRYRISPLWPKAKAFCAHLRRQNPGLVEITREQHQAALEAKEAPDA